MITLFIFSLLLYFSVKIKIKKYVFLFCHFFQLLLSNFIEKLTLFQMFIIDKDLNLSDFRLFFQAFQIIFMYSSTYLLDFDTVSGPVISREDGQLKLNPSEMECLRGNSFPESAIPLGQETQTFFSFSINTYFAYALYVSRKDEKEPRGFSIFTIVILTQSTYFKIYQSLLESASKLRNSSKIEMYQLITQFSKKIQTLINENSCCDLPLLDGILPFVPQPSTTSLELLQNSKTYKANENFIGSDLNSSLFTDELAKSGRLCDLTRLWECVMTDQPILVLGATPKIATLAVFTIASLKFPEKLTIPIMPYISMTDPRFMEICEDPKGIIGVSNPMALALATKFTNVFRVGFEANNGFGPSLGKSQTHSSSTEIRSAFFTNTERLRVASTTAIDELICSNFINVLIGKVEEKVVEKQIRMKGVIIVSDPPKFVEHLIESSFFTSLRCARLTMPSIVHMIAEYDVKATIKEAEAARRARQRFAKAFLMFPDNKDLRKVLKHHIKVLTSAISN